jgi:putative hydrolase of the HAD superfamily
MVLATKGEPALQQQKVRRLGLAHFFRRMYFVERKTEHEYRRIIGECAIPASAAWAVGNSFRSDVNPALHIGMHAIWLRRPTWLYEEMAPEGDGFVPVQSLTEAAEVLLTADDGAADASTVSG